MNNSYYLLGFSFMLQATNTLINSTNKPNSITSL